MRFSVFNVNGKEYKLRLGANEIVNLEKKLGDNPLNVLVSLMKEEEVPKITELLIMLHAALQKFNQGLKLEDVYNLYDEFIDSGGEFADLMEVVFEVFEVSGFFKKEQVEEMMKKEQVKEMMKEKK